MKDEITESVSISDHASVPEKADVIRCPSVTMSEFEKQIENARLIRKLFNYHP